MKIMTKPPSNDQGPAFLSHSLLIILFGPFYVRDKRYSWVVENRVPTPTYCVDLQLVFITWDVGLLQEVQKKISSGPSGLI